MGLEPKLFLPLLLLGNCLAANPLQESIVRGLQLVAQLIQVNDDSPFLPFLKSLQQRISQPPNPPKGEEGEEAPTGLWGTLFRSIGFKYAQIPAIAVNLLMFLAQMVSNSFPNPEGGSQRGFRSGKSLMFSVLEQPKVSRMLSTMQDPRLLENVLKEVEGRLSGSQSDCVVQLLCRGSPIVRGMQTSLAFFLRQETSVAKKGPARGEVGSPESNFDEQEQGDNLAAMTSTWKKLTPMERMLFFMPSLEELMTAGDACRKKYRQCLN